MKTVKDYFHAVYDLIGGETGSQQLKQQLDAILAADLKQAKELARPVSDEEFEASVAAVAADVPGFLARGEARMQASRRKP